MSKDPNQIVNDLASEVYRMQSELHKYVIEHGAELSDETISGLRFIADEDLLNTLGQLNLEAER